MLKACSLVLPLLLSSVPTAFALDCSKALTRDEKAICGDAKLKAQDAALSRFYFDTLKGLSGERHALLIADQRQWLKDERAGHCKAVDKTVSRIACLTESLESRRRALAICFADEKDGEAALAPAPITASDICTVGLHPGCPRWTVRVSAQLERYQWLVQDLIDHAKTDDADCAPESADAPGTTPDQNETIVDETLLAERPGFVSVHYEDNVMYRGAPHEMHSENILSYDTRTQADIPLAPWSLVQRVPKGRRMPALVPTLREGSKLLATINKAVDGKLFVPCCGDEDDQQHTFAGIGLSPTDALPDGWAVSADGGLLLGYSYRTLDRDFMATATLPRGVFIEAVDPRYAGLFVASAKSDALH